MSGIWWHNEEQKDELKKFIDEVEKTSSRKVETYVAPLTEVYRAEEYHQQYFDKQKSRYETSA